MSISKPRAHRTVPGRAPGLRLAAGLALLLAAAPGFAQSAAPESLRVWGSFGFGPRFIDESGRQNLLRERSDIFKGLSVRGLAVHALTTRNWSVDLDAPVLGEAAHDVSLGVRNRFVRGAMRSASSRFFYNADGSLQSRRSTLTGDLEVRPERHVQFFGNLDQHDRTGARQAIVPGDEGELGTLYDLQTTGWRAGARVLGLRSTLQASVLGRDFHDFAARDFDRTTRGAEVILRSEPRPRLRGWVVYGHARTELDRDSTYLVSDQVSGAFDVQVRPDWSLGPRLRYEESTDLAPRFTSKIWAVGAGANRRGSLWDVAADGDWGRRSDASGAVDTWGANGTGSVRLRHGLRLEVGGRRLARTRGDVDVLRADQGPLKSIVGTVQTRQVQTRLRLQPGGRWSAGAQVARLRKSYDDIGTRIATWRYVVDASASLGSLLHLDAGWRLDDTADSRATGAYALRTHGLYAGCGLEPMPRLHLRAHVDVLDMQRSLQVRKTLVSAAVDWDVRAGWIGSLEYENDRYDDDVVTDDTYRGNILLLTLRRDFRL